MPFGKHAGKKLDEVPLMYLDWLLGQDWLRDNLREPIRLYLNDPVIERQLELEMEE